MRSLCLALLVAVLAGCANLPPRPGSDEEGQRYGALYLKTLRWESVDASKAFIAPNRRVEYVARIKAGNFIDKLKITEFEAKDLTRTGKDTATMDADLSWYIEPEVTVHNDHLTLDLRHDPSGWSIEGIESGPLPFAPLPPAAPDAGAP